MSGAQTKRDELVLIWGDLTEALGPKMEPKVFDAYSRLTTWLSKTRADNARAERIEAAARELKRLHDGFEIAVKDLSGPTLASALITHAEQLTMWGDTLFAALAEPVDDAGRGEGEG